MARVGRSHTAMLTTRSRRRRSPQQHGFTLGGCPCTEILTRRNTRSRLPVILGGKEASAVREQAVQWSMEMSPSSSYELRFDEVPGLQTSDRRIHGGHLFADHVSDGWDNASDHTGHSSDDDFEMGSQMVGSARIHVADMDETIDSDDEPPSELGACVWQIGRGSTSPVDRRGGEAAQLHLQTNLSNMKAGILVPLRKILSEKTNTDQTSSLGSSVDPNELLSLDDSSHPSSHPMSQQLTIPMDHSRHGRRDTFQRPKEGMREMSASRSCGLRPSILCGFVRR